MIIVPVLPGDVADRLSILKLKHSKFSDQRVQAELLREIKMVESAFSSALESVKHHEPILQACANLDLINSEAWEIIDFHVYWIEKCDYLKVGQLAAQMHILNQSRVRCKNDINTAFGCDLKEVKLYENSLKI